MASPSPGCAITVRAETLASPDATSGLVADAREAEGVLTAPNVVESQGDHFVVDVTCDAIDSDHARRIEEVLVGAPGICVREVQDRPFLVHFGGKLRTASKVPMAHREDLSRAYTPGAARICRAIAENPADVRSLTLKGDAVAVVTGGSAVLGLGNIGPAAALPVVEGKAVLFERSAGVDARPVCLDVQDPERIVDTAEAMAPAYGDINLEGIAASRCFEVERRLREELDIPGVPRRPARNRDRRARGSE